MDLLLSKIMYLQRTIINMKLDYPVDHWYKFKKNVKNLEELLLGHPSKRGIVYLKPHVVWYHLEKSFMRRNNLPDIPFCFYLKMKLSCQTLWNPFEMSRSTPRAAYPLSKDAYIPWINVDRFKSLQVSSPTDLWK